MYIEIENTLCMDMGGYPVCMYSPIAVTASPATKKSPITWDTIISSIPSGLVHLYPDTFTGTLEHEARSLKQVQALPNPARVHLLQGFFGDNELVDHFIMKLDEVCFLLSYTLSIIWCWLYSASTCIIRLCIHM